MSFIDSRIKMGLEKKQPVNHIIHTHNLPISVSTAYRWIQNNILSSKTIDLQKAVSYKIVPPERKRITERKN